MNLLWSLLISFYGFANSPESGYFDVSFDCRSAPTTPANRRVYNRMSLPQSSESAECFSRREVEEKAAQACRLFCKDILCRATNLSYRIPCTVYEAGYRQADYTCSGGYSGTKKYESCTNEEDINSNLVVACVNHRDSERQGRPVRSVTLSNRCFMDPSPVYQRALIKCKGPSEVFGLDSKMTEEEIFRFAVSRCGSTAELEFMRVNYDSMVRAAPSKTMPAAR